MDMRRGLHVGDALEVFLLLRLGSLGERLLDNGRYTFGVDRLGIGAEQAQNGA